VAGLPDTERGPDGRIHQLDLDLSGQCLEGVTFTDVTFAGETHFDRCTFTGETRFENCAFTGYVSFVGATADRLVFRDCRFGHIVNLGETAFAELSVRRSEFDAAVELELSGAVDIHLTTFAGRSRLTGAPRSLELRRVAFRSGARLVLGGSDVTLYDVELGAPSSLGSLDRNRPVVRHVVGTDLAPLRVYDTDLSRCTFVGAHNLDGLGVESLDAFSWAPRGPLTRRRVVWDEVRLRAEPEPGHRGWRELAGTARPGPGPAQVAADYRALRKARENAKDEPGAADFYYGEMEMRRMARHRDMRAALGSRRWGEWAMAATEHTLLWLYWAVSGYGLRAWRALAALVVVVLGAAVVFRYAGFPGDTHTYAASLRFSVQSAMSLLRGTDEALTPTGEWVALALRLLGPLLAGLALLALRGRVRR